MNPASTYNITNKTSIKVSLIGNIIGGNYLLGVSHNEEYNRKIKKIKIFAPVPNGSGKILFFLFCLNKTVAEWNREVARASYGIGRRAEDGTVYWKVNRHAAAIGRGIRLTLGMGAGGA